MPLVVDPGLYQDTKSDIFWVQPKRTLPTAFKLFTGQFFSIWQILCADVPCQDKCPSAKEVVLKAKPGLLPWPNCIFLLTVQFNHCFSSAWIIVFLHILISSFLCIVPFSAMQRIELACIPDGQFSCLLHLSFSYWEIRLISFPTVLQTTLLFLFPINVISLFTTFFQFYPCSICLQCFVY